MYIAILKAKLIQPTTTNMSAILNVGKLNIGDISIKSITVPLKILSIKFPNPPAKINDNDIVIVPYQFDTYKNISKLYAGEELVHENT